MTPWICIHDDPTHSARSEAVSPLRAESHSSPLRQAVERCFLEFRDQAFRYLRALGCEHSMAEEITQETFLRLYRALESGPKVQDERAWVFRVARNLFIDHRREHQRYAPAFTDEEGQRDAMPSDTRPDPEQQVLEQERTRLIAEEVQRMPELQRECMHLRAQGLRYREIAMTLGISLPAAVDSIRRAVKRLGSIAGQ